MEPENRTPAGQDEAHDPYVECGALGGGAELA